MKKSISCLVVLVYLFCFTNVNGQSYVSEEGYVEFESSAPLLTFKGISNNLTGLIDFDQNLVDFYVDLNTIDTGIRLRNRHMRESYLETDKFPFAEFTGRLTTEFDFQIAQPQPATVTGTFKIHGVEREIDVEGNIQLVSDGLLLTASWVVRLEDYNIDRPSVIFYELAEEQKVSISITLKPAN